MRILSNLKLLLRRQLLSQTSSQYISFSHSGQTGNTFVLDLPNATLTNNFYNLTFSYQWVTSQPTITVTDQGTLNTWVNSISLANTTDNINTKVYTVTGETAGVTQITVVFSASVSDFHWEFQELNGIATSSAIDGTSVSAVATAPYVSAGSITTTQSNDLIYRDCVYTSNGMWTSVSTAIYHPGGNYSFLRRGQDRIERVDGLYPERIWRGQRLYGFRWKRGFRHELYWHGAQDFRRSRDRSSCWHPRSRRIELRSL